MLDALSKPRRLTVLADNPFAAFMLDWVSWRPMRRAALLDDPGRRQRHYTRENDRRSRSGWYDSWSCKCSARFERQCDLRERAETVTMVRNRNGQNGRHAI